MTNPAANLNYTVLARRFRPQAFGEVVGQEHIAQALRNAIRGNRVAHAYLFTGARGVGKTSTARILAKALNCPHAVDGDPCNECEICRGISVGNDVDVLEIDGASNRGIDDIRQLRATVNVKSMRTRFKVYIIDEVHMLTKEAFNALLKTLEEPPPSVKFVFCTTEPNKVPDTILSRCQRFDFGTIATDNIRLRLEQIAAAEGVEIDAAAFDLVARRAAGSMRDSQSILDQLLAFGEARITAADVHRLLGTASDDGLVAIVDALVRRKPSDVLNALHAALESGVQLGELTDQLLFYFRDLMVMAAGADQLDLLAVAAGCRPVLKEQAAQWGLQTIAAAMQILADTKGRMQRVTYGRALAELALVRLAMLENLASLDKLIEQLRQAPTHGPTANSDTPASLEKKNELAEGPGERSQGKTTVQHVVPVERCAAEPAQSRLEATSAESEHETASDLEPDASVDSEPERLGVETQTVDSDVAADCTEPVVHSPVLKETLSSDATELWAQVLADINDMLRSHAKAVSQTAIIGPNTLELTFPRRYHFAKRYCEKPEALRRLEELASRFAGRPVRIATVFAKEGSETNEPADEDSSVETTTRKRIYKPEADEFVAQVMNLFSAQVMRVDAIGSGRPPEERD